MHVSQHIAAQWKHREGELFVGSLPISSIVERHGTPLFVYDQEKLESRYSSLRQVLPSRISIYYSIKANPNPAFLRFFVQKGCGLEVASAGELQQALAAGCPADEILFAGPGKTEAELALAISHAIGEIHAESKVEIDRISGISASQGRRTAVALRVNPGEEGRGGAMQMGGKPAPFGIDEENLDPLLQRVASDRNLEFCGIHLFSGTQILDYRVLLAQYRKGIEIARRMSATVGLPLRTVDFGGGLGIPYFAGESALDLTQLGIGLHELMATIEQERFFEATRFVVEPGRFLVGEAGLYVARITDIKTSRGKKYLILDGGMNHHLAASGNLGQIIKRNFPIAIISKFDSPAMEEVDVVGPLCTPLDTLGRALQFPTAEIGDLVGVFQSGAYARAASPLGFLSHPTPPEVLVRHDEDLLIRRRGTFQDFFQDIAEPSVSNRYASAPIGSGLAGKA